MRVASDDDGFWDQVKEDWRLVLLCAPEDQAVLRALAAQQWPGNHVVVPTADVPQGVYQVMDVNGIEACFRQAQQTWLSHPEPPTD